MELLSSLPLSPIFATSALIGFVAQMVGSSLGMAYSTFSTSVLLSLGVSPAMASASVHTSEVVNRLVSGISHFRFGNVDAKMFRQLAVYGMAGAFCGAFVVISLPVRIMRPCIAFFLLYMGIRIVIMGIRQVPRPHKNVTRLSLLGFMGGFADVIGGGGWGPVVTSTLVIQGNRAQLVVGSINFAKFFVAVVESVTLITLLKSPQWAIIGGLISGGVLAAPLAAYTCMKLPPRPLMVMVGVLICFLSSRTLLRAFV